MEAIMIALVLCKLPSRAVVAAGTTEDNQPKRSTSAVSFQFYFLYDVPLVLDRPILHPEMPQHFGKGFDL